MMREEAFEDLVVVDVETSGINPFKHQILSLALVPIDRAKPTLELYIREGEPEWQDVAAAYFRNSLATWRNEGRSPKAACDALVRHIESAFEGPVTMVGHNVGFDVAFLRQLASRAGLDQLPLISHRALDTHTILFLLYARGIIPRGALSSSGAFAHFGIGLEPGTRHTALGDALATRELFIRAVELLEGISPAGAR